MKQIRRFSVQVSEEALEDLFCRLENIRWPDELDVDPWSQGTDKTYLVELTRFWRDEFDWREVESELANFDHYLCDIDGLDTHFIHQRSPHPNATPLLLTHGWPGSIMEFLDVIPRLTHPERFGRDPSVVFHVVCPSLPGFGWSQASTQSGMNARSIALRHASLMATLGYEEYVAQGGDWGSVITRQLALVDPQHCKAIHLNMIPLVPDEQMLSSIPKLSVKEQTALGRSNQIHEEGMGYFHIQSTRPQTLSYGLADSPIGLAAWITEKFHGWSDCEGDIETVISRQRLLGNITLYWLTNTIASSIRLYKDEADNPSASGYVAVPTGAAIYPQEIVFTPRSWAEKAHNLVYWSEKEKGGHFAALEQPAIFSDDLRDFVTSVLPTLGQSNWKN